MIRICSEEVLQETLARPEVKATRWFNRFEGDLRLARETLQEEDLTVSPIRGTTLIQIAVRSPYPDDAPIIVDAIVTVYMQKLHSDSTNEIEGIRRTFLQESTRADEEVRQLDTQIRQFTAVENLETLNTHQSAASIRYAQLTQTQTTLEIAYEEAKAVADGLTQSFQLNEFNPSADDVLQMEATPALWRIKHRILELNQELHNTQKQLGKNHRAAAQLKIALVFHHVIIFG